MSSNLLRYLNALMRCLPDRQTERRPEPEHACLLTADIVICCRAHFTTGAQLASACSLLFNNEFGILAFLRKCVPLDEFHKSKTNLLEYLPSFIDRISKSVLKYALEIKNVCVFLFNSDKNARVRISVFGVLIKVVKFCSGTNYGSELEPRSMMETFYKKLTQQSKLTPTVLQGIYHFLGVLVETFPEYVDQYAGRLLSVYFSELKKQMTSKTKASEKPIIAGCFSGLTALLNSSPQQLKTEETKQLFTYVRMAVRYDRELARYEIPRESLQLICKHAVYFSRHLYEDYKYFYDNLHNWSQHSNRDMMSVAYLALEAFFSQVVAIMCSKISEGDDHRPAAELKFEFFLTRFKGIFESSNSSRWISVAVKGYGLFAAPCKLLLGANNVKVMFKEVLQHTEKVFFSDSELIENKIQFLPSFVESLASISSQLDEISETHLPSLENVAIYLIEHFPVLLPVHHFLCYHALIKMLVVLYPKGTIFNAFVTRIVYQGLLCTCSHVVMPEFDHDSGDNEEIVESATVDHKYASTVTYKNYLPLWTNLLDAVQLKALNSLGIPLAQRQAVADILYDEILSAIFVIIKKLDFSSLKSGQFAEDTQDCNFPTSDPIVGLRASNPKDFQIFVNLVDFCKHLLSKKSVSLFKKWIYKFGCEIISLSTKFPLVSGFYKLLAVCFENCSRCHFFKNSFIDDEVSSASGDGLSMTKLDEKSASFILFSKYAKEIVVRSQQYKDDLLISCLRAVLALPSEIVARNLSYLISAVCTAFRLGPSYIPIVHDGLRALEMWSSELSLATLLPLYRQVLPLLNVFLKTAIGLEQAEIVTIDGRKSLRNRSKKISLKVLKGRSKREPQVSLPDALRVKRRIVRLLGNLGTGVNQHLIDDSSRTIVRSAVAWDVNRHLKFAVPFADMKPSLDLDIFLPRVVELACSSSDRQAKVAASELLHALVLFMLGSSAGKDSAQRQMKPMVPLYKKVLPAMLHLSCDVDLVVRQLFEPLTMQLIHWFSRNLDENTDVLLDALMDGVVNRSSNALRDFSSKCIKEYLAWSIKHSKPKAQEKNPFSTKALLRRVYSSSLHPDSFVRLGAALIFNGIVTVFREEEALVNIFIFEMMYHFVQSLAIAEKDDEHIGTREQCNKALDHIERIVIRKSQLLMKKDLKRRIPKEFAASDLESAVTWLLEQCGRPETECRHRCMHLVYNLMAPLSCSVTVEYFKQIVKKKGVEFFISRFEGVDRATSERQYLHGMPTLCDHLLNGFSVPSVVSWFDALVAALDCYTWIFTLKALRPEEIFTEGNQSVVLASMKYFITDLSLADVKSLASRFDQPHSSQIFSPSEVDEFNQSKCTVIVRVLDFIEAVIQSSSLSDVTFHRFLNEVIQDPFWDLFLQCILCPLLVGFDMSNLEIMSNLPKKTEQLLLILVSSLPESQRQSITSVITRKIAEVESYDVFRQLSTIISLDFSRILSLSHLVSGSEQIHRAGILLPSLTVPSEDKDCLANDVFQAAWKMCILDRGGIQQAVRLEGVWQSLAQKILSFSFSLKLPVNHLIALLMDDGRLTDLDGHSYLQKGAHLLVTFRSQVIGYLARTAPDSIALLTGWAAERPLSFASVLLALLDHFAIHKDLRRSYGSVVSEAILTNLVRVRHWWHPDSQEDLKHLTVRLLTKLLIIDSKVIDVAHFAFGEVFEMFLALLVDINTTLQFKSRVLDALPFFLRLPNENLDKLRSHLARMASQNFPLKSSELKFGSLRCSEYISAFQKILYALEISGSVMLLEFISELVCTEPTHVCEKDLQATIQSFVKRLSNERISAAIEVPMDIFWNESNPIDVRQSALERISIPLLRAANKVYVLDFFAGKVKLIMSVLQEKPLKSTDEKFQRQLFSKLCCFKLMQVLYDIGNRDELNSLQSKVNKAFCDKQPKSGRELTQEATRAAHAAKKDGVKGETTFLEMRRRYRCAAYNALVAIISCTQTEAKFYNTFLFTENAAKGDFLWDNLVDTARSYEFAIEFNCPLERRKQMVDIRREARKVAGVEDMDVEQSFDVSLHHLTSLNLAGSSLSEDVAQFDFTSSSRISSSMISEDLAVISERKTEESKPTVPASYLDFELDDLNCHECMASLNAVLMHMTTTSISPLPPSPPPPAVEADGASPNLLGEDMPTWMKNMHGKLSSDDTTDNVKLFLAKVVINNKAIFQPYAKHWLYPLMQLVVGGVPGRGINYFVMDLVVILLSWSSVAIPEESALDRAMATRVLEFLMQNASHVRREILRNNLEIIKTLVECWKDRLDIPTKIVYDQLCDSNPDKLGNLVGIQLLGIVLANGLPPYSPVVGLNEDVFLETLAKNLMFKTKEVYGAAAEVVGMCLKHLSQRYTSSKFPFYDVVQKHLSKMSETQTDRFIFCLHCIQTSYPPMIDSFLRKILFVLPRIYGTFRHLGLEIVHSRLEVIDGIYLELKSIGFQSFLDHEDDLVQTLCLKIIDKMLRQMTVDQLFELLPSVVQFVGHRRLNCRKAALEILFWIYDNFREERPDIVSLTKEALLRALADDDPSLRLRVLNYWSDSSRLSTATVDRTLTLLGQLYSPASEFHFLGYATYLLLEMTSRSPDYNRPLFEDPLSVCKFEAYNVRASWRQQHSTMLPLFVETLSSASESGAESRPTPTTMHQLRATQDNLEFTPTQGTSKTYNWLTQSSSDTFFTIGVEDEEITQSNLLFNTRKLPLRTFKNTKKDFGKNKLKSDQLDSSTPGGKDTFIDVNRLRRRFLKQTEAEKMHHARRNEKQRQQRELRIREQKMAREAQVTIYRQYRRGDLPDIEITRAAIIAPLQALAQRDVIVAKMLFSHLFTGVLKEARDLKVDKDNVEFIQILKTVSKNLNAILETSTLYTAPLISVIQELGYHFPELKLDVENLVAASRTSFQQDAGILLLEKMIIDCPGADEPRPAKRPRGEVMSSPDKFLWAKLAELNKSVGCYDVVNGIFMHHVTNKMAIREALAAEATGDYSLAKKHYQKFFEECGRSDEQADVLDTDLWNECMLECFEKLNDWGKSSSLAVRCFDDSDRPSLDSVWDDVFHQEHYLPFVIRGKLRLILNGETEQALVTFLDEAQANLELPQRRQFLESRFSRELALLSIVQKDYDRARSYRDACLQGFLQDWLSMSELSSFHLKSRLTDLQVLVEMEDFLIAIEETGTRFEERSIHLMTKWEKSTPDALCNVAVLDDLAVNRRLYMKLLGLRPLPSAVSDQEEGFKDRFEKMCLRSQLSLSMTCVDAAARQNNSTVALAYLKDSFNLNGKLNDSFLASKWSHTYCRAHQLKVKKQSSHSKLATLFNVWKNLDKDLESGAVQSNMDLRLGNLLLQSQNAEIFLGCLEEDASLLKDASGSDDFKRLLRRIGCPTTFNFPQLSSSLTEYSYRQLEAAVALNESAQIAAAHLHLAKFCDRHLREAENGSVSSRCPSLVEFPKVIVRNLLAAVKLGSLEAMQLFPRLLQLVEKHLATRPMFVEAVNEIPCWMFLSWVSQLVSLLDKPHATAIHDLVEKIAKEYPNALIYPFMVSRKGFTFADSDDGKLNKAAVDRIWHLLTRLWLVQQFVFALEQLPPPYLSYQDAHEELFILKQKDNQAFKKLFEEIYQELFVKPLQVDNSKDNPVPYGKLRKQFAKKMGKIVDETLGLVESELDSMSALDFQARNNKILDEMKQFPQPGLLKDHSDWLSGFNQRKFSMLLEIPGQYRGYSKPMPEYHTKISRFGEKVLTLSSLRKPKCITIFGDDHKEYKFLVKGGEDLRLDQRVQQLFQIMNEIYLNDPACRSRQLSVVTYQVIPLNNRLGILEWVENTSPLKEFLESAMNDRDEKNRRSAFAINRKWMEKAVSSLNQSKVTQSALYECVYQNYDRNQTVKHYNSLIDIFPKNILKNAFLRMSASTEAYLTLRNHFIVSHAVVSISQYVLGIGDRHLSNFMICQQTGAMIAIDFGHAFGSATTLLPIPELMPMRLTPQFLQLMEPMREHGLFEMSLIHSLQALRSNKELLLNTMDVFINEPSLDWMRNARRQLRSSGNTDEDLEKDLSWYPHEKVNVVKQKLAGDNSGRIMAMELELGHKRRKVVTHFKKVCIGDEEHNPRSRLPGKGLDVEKQVACLLDHATDPHILGKTYHGWHAWV